MPNLPFYRKKKKNHRKKGPSDKFWMTRCKFLGNRRSLATILGKTGKRSTGRLVCLQTPPGDSFTTSQPQVNCGDLICHHPDSLVFWITTWIPRRVVYS